MKKLILLASVVLFCSQAYSQRTLEWSIGKAEIKCGKTIQICFPLKVSIKNSSNTPILGTSTMRFFYDANYLTNLSIENIQNGYRESGFNQSTPVFGEIFGFSNIEGVFAQFNIIDNAAVDPLFLNGRPVHVLDLCFDVTEIGEEDWAYYGSLSVPIVLDNNRSTSTYKRDFMDTDTGYLANDAGIVGSYFLNENTTHGFLADDEVINHLWNARSSYSGKVEKLKDQVGFAKQKGIKDVCGLAKEQLVEIEAIDLFSAFPVPFEKEVNIKYMFDYDTDISIEIYDVQGSIIKRLKKKDYIKGTSFIETINLSKVDNQMLFVRLTTNQSMSTKKILPSPNK